MSKAQSEAAKKRWQDSKYRKNQTKKQRIAMKKRWQDPEFRKKRSKDQKIVTTKLWQDPEYAKKVAESNKGKKRSEGAKKNMSAAKTGKNNPMYGRNGIDDPVEYFDVFKCMIHHLGGELTGFVILCSLKTTNISNSLRIRK